MERSAKKEFRSAKSLGPTLVIWLMIILHLALIVAGVLDKNWWMVAYPPVMVAFFAWMWFDTRYTLIGRKLYYRSGPVRGSLDVGTIRKIERNVTYLAGEKPALATRGLLVRYNKWDEVYISPTNKEQFIAELLKVNPEIEITESGQTEVEKQKAA